MAAVALVILADIAAVGVNATTKATTPEYIKAIAAILVVVSVSCEASLTSVQT